MVAYWIRNCLWPNYSNGWNHRYLFVYIFRFFCLHFLCQLFVYFSDALTLSRFILNQLLSNPDIVFFATCHRYDVDANTWQEMQPMILDRFFHSSCHLSGYIYVFGGWTTNHTNKNPAKTNIIERLDN